MKALKVTAAVAGVALVLLIIGLGINKKVMDARYFDGYDPNAPLNIEVVASTEVAGAEERTGPRASAEDKKPLYLRTHLYFDGFRGERVPTLIATPLDLEAPFPCVIFLHGIGQEKEFLDEIAAPFIRAGFAFATFDQFTRGERKLKNVSGLDELKAMRLRPAYTVQDTRRLVDYLYTRDDIAHDRIYLFGASYGAITGSTAAAFDERIRAAVLCYGGARWSKLLTAREVAAGLGGWLPLAKFAAWYFMDVADPANYAGRIAPRPVLIQNGADDGLIADEAARALQNAVREPKDIRIYAGDHIGTDEKTLWRVIDDSIEWLGEQDAKLAQPGRPAKAAA
ncbi:MAG: prolyl oligopeptidase family serine peptidase [Nitrospiraceae bacterium]|nr:prolyl oligopeptidase family serine peptidase [Nitrospiraceae bacterium]